jgi:uncharacterized secreted protein with C-terminal beta-propeller domain
MKRILLSITLFCSLGMADSVLMMKKGWQLVGSATAINDMSLFLDQNVEQVWHFDASTQKWLGYSPDSSIEQKMREHNISKLTSLKNWHGFWIKSKKDWVLKIEDTQSNQLLKNPNQPKDIIQLKKGWNLISLPVDSVVSADIFQGMTVWKYNSEQRWELFDQDEPNFPRLGHIKNSDGVWVKSPKDINISTMSEASKLHNFKTVEEMKNRIKEMATLYHRPYCGIYPVDDMGEEELFSIDAVALSNDIESSGSTRAENSTNTNLQESDVDEADILKHNGKSIFYISNSNRTQINVTTFKRLQERQTNPLTDIALEKNLYIEALYLLNNQLIVLSQSQGEYQYESRESHLDSMPNYRSNFIQIDTFDVQDLNHITKIASHKVDGGLVTSRIVGDRLYLVSSFNPQFNIDYPKKYIEISPTCQAYFDKSISYDEINNNPYRYTECYDIQKENSTGKYFRYDYENPIITVKDLLPEIEENNLPPRELITPNRLYVSANQKQSTTITTLLAIDISNNKYLNSISYIGSNHTQYASSEAFYLLSNNYPIYYDYYHYQDRSTIYKFNLDDQLSYQGIGSVYGNPINQFSLSEHNGILRIATTDGFSWGGEKINNRLYTLKEQNRQLVIQGALDGLGEEGESIRAVRFMGDRGYIVTARTSDPLYTLDLSDPLNPQKVGELHISGYSSYLHPIGESRLLGIGQEVNDYGQTTGLKVELFDVSDFSNPTSLDTIRYAPSSYSELEYNHKALAYRSSDQLFAFPYQDYGKQDKKYEANSYLGIYQIKNDDLIAFQPMRGSKDNWGENRGLIFDMDNHTYISLFNGNTITTKELNKTEITK